jgi:hypothetical protein
VLLELDQVLEGLQRGFEARVVAFQGREVLLQISDAKPARESVPEFGLKRLVSIRNRLVFPEPFSPNRTILSPGWIVSETFSRTVLSGKEREMSSSRASNGDSFAYEVVERRS